MHDGRAALRAYLERARALPLRDYVPLLEGTRVATSGRKACKGQFTKAEIDDDLTYTVLALTLVEEHGCDFQTEDVARAWMTSLPGGNTFTAERAAYSTLLEKAKLGFVFGREPGFDLAECSQNPYNEWIGAQIRADLYGWVCPGEPALAADLARRDGALSHRGDGLESAAFLAAMIAAIPVTDTLSQAFDRALGLVSGKSGVAQAASFARSIVGSADAVDRLHQRYAKLPAVHALNNLSVVVWAVLAHPRDFSAAVGEAVSAGWDTDCNGATVGGMLGLAGVEIPRHWTEPWNGSVTTGLVGGGVVSIDELSTRTLAAAEKVRRSAARRQRTAAN